MKVLDGVAKLGGIFIMEKTKITSFEDLIVWQKAQDLAVNIYKLVEKNEVIRKDFGL